MLHPVMLPLQQNQTPGREQSLMVGLAQNFAILWGWRRIGTAFALGVLAAASMQPLLLWPVLLISFPVLIWLLDGIAAERSAWLSTAWHGFLTGWSFGFGYFLASLYWIGHAFLVDAETYAWMLPLAVAALPAAMALYWGFAAAFAALFWAPGIRGVLLLAGLLSIADWLRGHLFTGFPWNALGYAAEPLDGIAQLAAYIGLWGLTFLTILWASLPALLGHERLSVAGKLMGLGLVLAALPLWTLGSDRLGEPRTDSNVKVRILQPNVPQADKWRSDNASQMFADLLQMSSGPGTSTPSAEPSHVVWPESSVPFLIDEQPAALSAIAAAIPDATTILMGSLRRSPRLTAGGSAHVYNSLFAIGGDGQILATYDKAHLVPYGEYLPLENWLEPMGFRRLVTIPGSFAKGEGPVTLALKGAPSVSPLICYETIFPGQVADRKQRPGWLLNLTNDGWFGRSSGPYQHLAQAKFRAIEEGLPLVRAANTGISAVIDPYGRILHSLPLGEKGMIDSRLPLPIPPPPYARIGDLAFFLMALAALGLGLAPRLRARAAARI
jgi:apolipoprotein N-acyltransferase